MGWTSLGVLFGGFSEEHVPETQVLPQHDTAVWEESEEDRLAAADIAAGPRRHPLSPQRALQALTPTLATE